MEELTPEEQRLFHDAFNLLNKDRDKSITTKELGAVLRALGRNPTESELQDMINEVDNDGNGSMEYAEFAVMLAQKLRSCDNEDDLREAFRIFDKENNGFITSSDLRTVFTALGEKLGDDELEEMIREADTDQDGRISFEEFVNMMTTK